MTTQLDLLGADDPTILSIAQADDAVWASISAQAQQLATAAGFYIQAMPPTGASYERTIDSIGAVQDWLATQNTGAVAAAAPQETDWSLVVFAGAALVLVVGGFIAAIKLAGRGA